MTEEEKRQYWDRRNEGLRGQGDKPTAEIRWNLFVGRKIDRMRRFGKISRALSNEEKVHHERQAKAQRLRIRRREQGERERIAAKLSQ